MLKNNINSHQKGVGMMEILVAILLLAVAVLGYVALQTKAISASSESVVKTQALSVMKGLAESIRTNNQARNSYPAIINGNLTLSDTEPLNCKNNNCNITQIVTYDAYQAARYANEFGLKVAMGTCPGVVTGSSYPRQCLFTVWGKTTLSAASSTLDYSKCMSSSTGIYVAGSSCLMMEIY